MRCLKFGAFGLVLAIAAILTGGVAQAQYYTWNPWYSPYNGYGYGSSYGYGSDYGSDYGYGAGSYSSGMANLVRAQGQANASNAQAEVDYEKARSVYLDNKKKWTQDYFQMRAERQARDALQREKNKPSAQTLAAVARSNLPRQLGPHSLDPVTGRIAWPEALQKSEYAADRTELEQLFAHRVQTGQAAGTASRIHTVTAELAEQLRRHIEDVPAKEYMSSRKFLDSLDYAAHSHAG